MRSRKGVSRRGSAVVTALLTAVLAAGTGGLPVASAKAPDSGPTPANSANSATTVTPATPDRASQVRLDGVGPGPHTVTLVTGDRVTLTDGAGGVTVQVDPAARQVDVAPVFLQQSDPDGLYVLPSDAMAAVQAGRVDRELFNVKYLVENGYADDDTARMPVIVQYPTNRSASTVAAAADSLPASTPTVALPTIGGTAVKVDKKTAGDFWARLAPPVTAGKPGGAALNAGVTRLWLDRVSHVTLDVSVPLIGAPEMWSAGYDGTGVTVAMLDTGYDPTHPDLAGKVVDSRTFLDGGTSVVDGHGHGTHVASTIVGSGAASDGRYRGVAPGAKLLVGKVCDDTGSCPDSAMLAGMDWAAHSGAKVISLSVGGGPSDGNDLLSQAVNDLTAQTGTLFVIAAGNIGPGAETVSSPGTAQAALTVAATDKSDALANFSSRGPRLDGGLKPDIAAPGVNIVAARAAGTTLGAPVSDSYTSSSGTSMATPHVSGAAAILAQKYPEWTAAELKAALMSTATDVPGTPYERGAGRLDLADVPDLQVVATTANADFGLLGDDTTPVNREVSYRNLSEQPVTLTLDVNLAQAGGGQLDDRVQVSPSTLTVPAGGTATATVTLDQSDLALGTYSGAVTATAAGVSLTTPVGADRAKPHRLLTVHTIGIDGQPATPIGQSTIDVAGDRGRLTGTSLISPDTTMTIVPEGTVSLAQWITWVDRDSRANLAYLVSPEITVDGDTEVTLDARTASQLTIDTPQPAEPLNNIFDAYIQRTTPAGESYGDHVYFTHPVNSWGRLWATPTEPVRMGGFRFATQWILGEAEVRLSMVRPDRQPLHTATPQHGESTGTGTPDIDGHPDFRFFTGTRDLPVVDVGLGEESDVSGVDLTGKLALLETDVCAVWIAQIGRLRDAGAAGIVAFPSASIKCPIPMAVVQRRGEAPAPLPLGVPLTNLSSREAAAVRAELASGPVTLRVTGTPETPYTYSLKPYEEGRIPNSLHYTFDRRDLAQVDLSIHAPGGPTRMSEYQYAWKPDDDGSPHAVGLTVNGMAFTAPRSRTDWVGPLAPDVLHTRTVYSWDPQRSSQRVDIFDQPVRLRQQWFTDPVTPGADLRSDEIRRLADAATPNWSHSVLAANCTICRSGNRLWPQFSLGTGIGDGQWYGQTANIAWFRFELDKDGTAVPELFPGEPFFGFPIDDVPGTYHLSASTRAGAPFPQTNVRWTFQVDPLREDNQPPGYQCLEQFVNPSGECQPQSTPFVGFDMNSSLAMDNTVPAGRQHSFTVSAYHSQTEAAMPAIAGVRVWTSTDDGASWQEVSMKSNRDGTYTAKASYPAYGRTTGAVSLRAEAWDVAGNRVEQTTLRAFGLSDPSAPRPTNAR